jgi:Cu+-exporting ATPase
VKPGETIPTDGVVLSGSSTVDEAMLTGESLPILKEAGAEVFAATLNRTGSFVFKATRVGAETALARIIRLVEEAQGSKAPIQRLADKVASVFVPTVFAVGVVTFLSGTSGSPSPPSAAPCSTSSRCSSSPAPAPWAWPRPRGHGGDRPGAEHGILIKGGRAWRTPTA